MSFINKVIEWLDKSKMQPHELLSDLAAMNELFVIDGDSLLLETMKHEIVDWSVSAGEYLQVAYLVEAFLNELVQRGATFHIVFFDLMQLAYWQSFPVSQGASASPESLLLLRSAVIGHLKYKTNLAVDEYKDWSDPAFESFLSTVRPSFALVSPSTSTSAAERVRNASCDSGIPISLLAAASQLKIFSSSVALAFFSELHFKDRFIWAESVQPFDIAEHGALSAQVQAQLMPNFHRVYNALIAPIFPSPPDVDASFTEINADQIITKQADGVLKTVLGSDNAKFDTADYDSYDLHSWRSIVAALAIKDSLAGKSAPKDGSASQEAIATLSKVLLIQTVLCNHMAPHLRPRSHIAPASEQSPAYKAALSTITKNAARIASALLGAATDVDMSTRDWDMIDIIDSRLLLSILSILKREGAVSSVQSLGFDDAMLAELQSLWSIVKGAKDLSSFFPLDNSCISITISDRQTLTSKNASVANEETLASLPMIPVRSTMVDRMILEDSRMELKESDYHQWYEAQAEGRQTVMSYPWKQSRALDFSALMYYDKEYEERKTNKNYSTSFHAHWAKLAQSLDARPTQTAVLQPKVLMRDEMTAQQALDNLLAKLELESKPKTVLNELREKEIARVKSLVTSWRGSPLARRISTLAGFVPTTASAYFDWLYALLDVHVEQYRVLKNEKETAAKSTLSPSSIAFVQHRLKTLQRDEIFDQCVSMIVQCGVGMLEYKGTPLLSGQSAVMSRLTEIFDQLGLASLHNAAVAAKVSSVQLEASGAFPESEEKLQSASRFQMARMGPWMKRDVGAVADPRANRLLDSWQIDVLNCIDSYKSTLVVVPTSAGKSYMGFHAMQRTLETDDGILVYVAPTKALVNQVVAEVYSKFSKANSPPGTVICGAFTREMRIAPIYARILVTVPQCLEILLLARELAGPGGWRSKLRWVIFDEIHCINMDDGAIWERLLPLVPCPFMALSATVGDVDRFQAWLRNLAVAKQEYASERPTMEFEPKVEEVADSKATASSAASASAAVASAGKTGATKLHPKIAEKLAKKQAGKQKGGQNRLKKAAAAAAAADAEEAAAAAATAASSSSSAAASSVTENDAESADGVKWPGYVSEPFRFIEHPHRYSDLYKYVVVPKFFLDGVLFESTAKRPESLTNHTVNILSELRAMHPWMGLPASRFQSDVPPTSSFSPRECLQVYQAMAKFAAIATSKSSVLPDGKPLQTPLASELTQELAELKPETYFVDGSIIDQRIMRKYEARLKSLFYKWAQQNEQLTDAILKDLTGDMLTELHESTSASIPLGKDLGSEAFLLESLPNFIDGLKEQSWLPAIVFNFDPQFCERMAIALNAAMVEKEAVFRSSAEYRNARIKYLEEMKEYDAEQKRRERASKKKKDKRNDEDLDKEGDPTMDMPVDPDYELADGTTFTRDGEVEHLDDLKRELTSLKNRGINGLLVDAIRRGIGVHHNGLDKKYRQAVEHHFRTGQIKVVFSTETLALGMNMPCRTTVFAGDSPNLTPLQYRQMSGRAGRRGYDPLGRVILWGIPFHRITYLEGAKLAPIRGQFPLSISFNLRGLVLGTADVTGAKKKKKQIEEEATADRIQPGAKKAAAAKKAAEAKKKAAEVSKAPKGSWDDSSDEEDDDEESILTKKKAAPAAPVKASWDDSSDDEEDGEKASEENGNGSAAAAGPAVVDDEVLVSAEKKMPPAGATEIFTSLQHVYKHSLYLHQHAEMHSQLDIHTQCSLQYMVRLGIISPLGKPIGLAGIACHLNWAEPANIVFSRLLTTNIIRNMCTSKFTTLEEKAEKLLLLTAHLFSRVPVPAHRAGIFKELIQARTELAKHSPLAHCQHALFLPALPKDQQQVIDQHNRECLEVLNSVILPYASKSRPFTAATLSQAPEKWLQLSTLNHLEKSSQSPSTPTASDSLFSKVVQGKLDVVARSPLAALGGHGDLFTTQADLRTMRHGLTAADFGMLINEDAHGVEQPLNAYLWDLYKYGNYDWLRKFNMFSDADLFFHCNEYLVNMRTLRTAIMHRAQDPQHDAILRVLSKITKEFERQFSSVFKLKTREFAWITVRGVEGYSGDLQRHILTTTRISVHSARKIPTLKNRSYIFRIACRNESDKARLVELFSSWANDHWWLDEADSDDEEAAADEV